jgi:chromosome segregation ATPase
MTPLKVSTPGSSKKRPALSPRNPNMDNVLPLGADSTPHLAKLKISSPTPSAVMRNTPLKHASNSSGFGRLVEKALSPAKPEPPLSAKKRKQGPAESNFSVSNDFSIDTSSKKVEFSDQIGSFLLSPKAVKEIARSTPPPKLIADLETIDLGNVTSDEAIVNTDSTDSLPTPRRSRRNRSLMPTIPPELVRILGSLGGSLGAGLVEVGKDVGVGATNAVFTVGSVVGDQAEMLVDKAALALPRYSQVEVRHMMEKKNSLLNELAQTSLLLGISQEKQTSLEIESARLRNHEERLSDKVVQQENLIMSLNQELFNLRHERSMHKQQYEALIEDSHMEIEEWKRLCEEHKDRCGRLIVQLTSSEQTIVSTRDELTRERDMFARAQQSWDTQLQRITTDQVSVRSEMEHTVNNLASRLKQSDLAREEAESKARELREQLASEQRKSAAEIARCRENMSAQQEWCNQRLKEKGEQLQSQNQSVAVMKEQLREQETALQSARDLLRERDDELHAKDRSLAELKESLQQASGELDNYRSLHVADQSKIIEFDDTIAFYRAQMKSHDERLSALQEREQNLLVEVAQLQEKLVADNDAWHKKISDVNNQLQHAVEERSQQLVAHGQIQQQSQQSARELNEKLTVMEISNSSLSKQIAEFQVIVQSLNHELAEKSTEYERAVGERNESNLRCERLQLELTATTENALALTGKVKSQDEAILKLQSALHQLKEAHETELASVMGRESMATSLLVEELKLKSDSVLAAEANVREVTSMLFATQAELAAVLAREKQVAVSLEVRINRCTYSVLPSM